MTGDNNGRWAGSYDSPVDHRAYLTAVADVVKRLERDRSLAIHALHSRMPSAEQRAIFDAPPPGKRKVVVSTVLAETTWGRNDSAVRYRNVGLVVTDVWERQTRVDVEFTPPHGYFT